MTDPALQKRAARRSVALVSAIGFAAVGWLVGRPEPKPLVGRVANADTAEWVTVEATASSSPTRTAKPAPAMAAATQRIEPPAPGLREAPRVVRKVVVLRRSRAS